MGNTSTTNYMRAGAWKSWRYVHWDCFPLFFPSSLFEQGNFSLLAVHNRKNKKCAHLIVIVRRKKWLSDSQENNYHETHLWHLSTIEIFFSPKKIVPAQRIRLLCLATETYTRDSWYDSQQFRPKWLWFGVCNRMFSWLFPTRSRYRCVWKKHYLIPFYRTNRTKSNIILASSLIYRLHFCFFMWPLPHKLISFSVRDAQVSFVCAQ